MKLRALVAAALAALLVSGAAACTAWRALLPLAVAAEPRSFQVAEGAGLRQVARALEREGLVRHAWAFEALARWRGLGGEIRSGEYELSAADAPGEILAWLVEGRVRTHRVALPEGLTAAEIATRLAERELVDAEAFLAVVRDPGSADRFGVEGATLEGYLFPETYRLAKGLTAEEVVATFVSEFRAAWEPLAAQAEAQGLSMAETVTLASIVEKETGAPEERPLIAGVFHNRLRRGMRLETDPSVIYGIPDFDGNLRRVHLEDDSNPYNTYRIPGLPPGPIANPGAEALRAVVKPAETDYLFFVSRNDGTHVFSRSYREHAAAVDRYQRRRSGS